MRLFIFLLMVSSTAFTAEVATIEINPSNRNELLVILTEDSLQNLLDKNFLAHPCKARMGNNNLVAIRENGFPFACRAEITKFLLNNGYKASYDFRVFSK